ncbi:MAG: hypothetical protein RRY24_02785 [Clostridiales bacterium]
MYIIIAIIFLFILGFFLAEPSLILNATKEGVSTWYLQVLPALLPFFIINKLCCTYGGIDILGALLRPFTRKVLSLPGESAFVIATGYSTGAPVSSSIISSLRKEGSISKEVGNFLLPFTANVSPLFIFSVVAASFLLRADLGIYLAIVHYGSNIILGIVCLVLFRFKKPPKGISPLTEIKKMREKPIIPLGQGLSAAVLSGIETIMLIGGLIIVFFILIAILEYFQIFQILAYFLRFFGVPTPISLSLFSGITEITAGTKCTAATNFSISIKFTVISAILAFGGISTLCQIATQIKGTDLSLKFYLCYKTIQGIFAAIISKYMPIYEQAITLPLVKAQGETWLLLYIPFFIAFAFWLMLLFIHHHRHLQHRRLKKERSFYR